MAWSLDQLIDLNNGHSNHPLTYREELLCLLLLFSHFLVTLIITLACHYLGGAKSQVSGQISQWMTATYIGLLVYLFTNCVVQSKSPIDEVQNIILIPLVSLSMTLVLGKYVMLRRAQE
jgi:hypothetical protein